jgi:hypothetical protein
VGDHGQPGGHGLGDDHAEGLARVVGVGQHAEPAQEGGQGRVAAHGLHEAHVRVQAVGGDPLPGLRGAADDAVFRPGHVREQVRQEVQGQGRPFAGVRARHAPGHGGAPGVGPGQAAKAAVSTGLYSTRWRGPDTSTPCTAP